MFRAHRSLLAAATLLVAVLATGCRVTVRVEVGPHRGTLDVKA